MRSQQALSSSESILAMFVANKPSMKALVTPRSRHIPWVVHAKPVSGFGHGSMYCPECLKTDDVPYFRWQWRLGFLNVCKKHRKMMIDRCPNCKMPPWPCGSGVKSRIHPNFQTFLNCWNCGFDLGQCEQSSSDGDQSELVQLANGDPVTLGEPSASATEVLEALRSIGHIFLRNALRKRITSSTSDWADVAGALPSELSSINMIENISAKYRAPIVHVSLELMRDWPNRFVQFCESAKITRADFYDTGSLMPWWMQECVDKRLAKQNRSVGFKEVMQAIEELSKIEGSRPTNTDIRRYLGWQGERALRNVNQKRTLGSFEEWRIFCDEISHQSVLSTLRVDCRASFTRDLFVIALCARDNLSAGHLSLPQREKLTGTANLHEIVEAIELHWGLALNEPQSTNFNSLGGIDLQRVIHKRVKSLMRKLPSDLMRSPTVFRRFLFQHSTHETNSVPLTNHDDVIGSVKTENIQLALPFG